MARKSKSQFKKTGAVAYRIQEGMRDFYEDELKGDLEEFAYRLPVAPSPNNIVNWVFYQLSLMPKQKRFEWCEKNLDKKYESGI